MQVNTSYSTSIPYDVRLQENTGFCQFNGGCN